MCLSPCHSLLSALAQVRSFFPLPILSNVNNLFSKNRNYKLSQSHFLHRQTNSQRNMVELHRNYCLLIGQCLFLSVVGLKDNIDEISCTIVTFLAHLAWMSVFAWTGI